MVTTVINALIAGLLGAIAVQSTQSIVSATDTSGWGTVTASMFELIPVVVGIVVIVGMFVLLTQIRS